MTVILYPHCVVITAYSTATGKPSLDSSNINQLLNNDSDGLSLKANKAAGAFVCFLLCIGVFQSHSK